jgi:hypothetical protein
MTGNDNKQIQQFFKNVTCIQFGWFEERKDVSEMASQSRTT